MNQTQIDGYTVYQDWPSMHTIKPRKELKAAARTKAAHLFERCILQERDIAILEALLTAGLLTRHQLQRLFFTSRSRASRRLRLLFEQHVIKAGWEDWARQLRPEVDCFEMLDQDRSVLVSGLQICYTYGLDKVGLEALAIKAGRTVAELGHDKRRYDPFRYSHLVLHDLWISEAYTQMRLLAKRTGCDFEWHNERQAIITDERDATREIVRPDAVVMHRFTGDEGLAYQLTRFIEMDRGHTHWVEKAVQYADAQANGNWRGWSPVFPAVLCVVPHRQLERTLSTLSAQAPEVRFMVKSWPAFLAHPGRDWIAIGQKEPRDLLPSDLLAL